MNAQPAVITFRPDNILTVGLMGLTAFVGAVVLVQVLNRVGLLRLGGAPPVPSGTVATA